MTKNLYEFEKYSLWRILVELLRINSKRDTLLKRFGKHEAPTKGIKIAD